MGGGQDSPKNSAADPDDLDDGDMLDLPEDGERSTNALSLLLMVVGMIFIPLGLILVFLAIARGDNAKQSTTSAQTVVPEFAPPADALAGRWLIVRGDDTWVSYDSTSTTSGSVPAAGVKTATVDGGIVIEATGTTTAKVIGVALDADLKALSSGDPKVDQGLKTSGLETDRFPTAEFLIPDTDPIVLSRIPGFGDHLDLTAKGQLKLHGVTKEVEVKLTAQLLPADPVLIELTGTMPLNLGDFGVSPGSTGAVTFHLRLARAPDEVSGRDPHASTTVAGTAGSTAPGSANGPTTGGTTKRS